MIIVHVTHVALGLQSFRALEKDQERREEEHLMRNLHVVPFLPSFFFVRKQMEKVFGLKLLRVSNPNCSSFLSILSLHSPHYTYIHTQTHRDEDDNEDENDMFLRERDYAFL